MLLDRMETSTILRLGLIGLVLRGVLQFILDRSGTTGDAIDFGMGALMGAYITLLLIAAYRTGREKRSRRA